jgi:hypothetical protein
VPSRFGAVALNIAPREHQDAAARLIDVPEEQSSTPSKADFFDIGAVTLGVWARAITARVERARGRCDAETHAR